MSVLRGAVSLAEPVAGKFLRHTRVVETHVACKSQGPPSLGPEPYIGPYMS